MRIISKKQAKVLKYRIYFTGIPCRRGHISPRLVSCNHCVDCLKELEASRTERRKRIVAAYYERNKAGYFQHARNRRARMREAEGTHSADDIVRIRKAQKDRCASCRAKLNGAGHVDHITPLIAGGSNWPNNLQLLCEGCNLSKGAKDPLDFNRSRGFLL